MVRTFLAALILVSAGVLVPRAGERQSEAAQAQADAHAYAAPTTAAARDSLTGLWLGTLHAGLKELRILIRIEQLDTGPRAALTSLDQDNVERPADLVSIEARQLRLELKRLNAVYEGRLQEDGRWITGTFTQKGNSLPLALERTDRVPEWRRPQNPVRPFPYDEEEATFENQKAGIRLAGTLTVPRTPGPHPAVLLISGSGPQDRNETIFGHRPFLVIADYLTRRGLAVLRVDDRGVGQSTGTRDQSTTKDYVDDALAGVAYLKGRRDIDPRRIGLVGHSEGGLIAPIAAVRSPDDIAFIVLLAAPGLSGMELSLLQAQAMLEAAGASKEHLAFQHELQSRVLQVLKEETDETTLRARVQRVLTEELARAGYTEDAHLAKAQASMEPQIRRALSPWFRSFLFHDPATALHQVRCPVLALNGGRDTQVPARKNLGAIDAALRLARHPDYQLVSLPSLNHLFQQSETGALAEYGKIEQTFAPEALEVLGNWITVKVIIR